MSNRTRLIIILLGLLLILGFLALQFYFSDRNTTTENPAKPIVEETVGRGEVILTVKTSGAVESDKDILLRSPERSIVKTILVNAGSKVQKGDLLLELDGKEIQQDITRLKQQLESKRNTIDKYQLNKENSKLGMKQSQEVKTNRLNTLKKSLMQQEEALKVGGIDAARVERTKNEIALAESDLQNLIEKNTVRQRQMEADEKSLNLQIQMQEQEIAQKQNLMQNLRISAPGPGIIQEIMVQGGERVESEQLLIKMSDFTSYKVVAWASNSYRNLIQTGDSAQVLIENKKIGGVVGEISLLPEDQMIRFDVFLDNDTDPSLELNKSAAVEVICDKRENVLRIKKQESLDTSPSITAYRVRGEEKIKTEVILGIIGNEWCEVVSGLNEGDVFFRAN